MDATRFLLKSCPDTRVLMLTSFSGKERVKEALRSGAVGYLLKDTPTEELIAGAPRRPGQSLRTGRHLPRKRAGTLHDAMSELSVRAKEVAARVAELQGH